MYIILISQLHTKPLLMIETNIKIALCCKWNLENHGVSGEEQNNIKLINYLETKYFVHEIFEDVSDWEDNESFYPIVDMDDSLKYILIKSSYQYECREFAIKHNGLDKFVNVWRRYYKNKMNRCKNIKNLLNRQLTGRRLR